MLNRGSGSKALGLCMLTVLALMSFMGASAHAANDWLIQNGMVDELIIQPIVVQNADDTIIAFETKVGLSTVKISCEKTNLKNGLLGAEGKSSGEVELSKCETLLNGKSALACKPAEPLTLSLQGTPFIHAEKMYELVVPAKGTSFGIVKLGKECAIGSEFEVTGTMVIAWCDNIEQYLEKHLEFVDNDALFTSGEHVTALKLGKTALTLSGSIFKQLVNSTARWKFMP